MVGRLYYNHRVPLMHRGFVFVMLLVVRQDVQYGPELNGQAICIWKYPMRMSIIVWKSGDQITHQLGGIQW